MIRSLLVVLPRTARAAGVSATRRGASPPSAAVSAAARPRAPGSSSQVTSAVRPFSSNGGGGSGKEVDGDGASTAKAAAGKTKEEVAGEDLFGLGFDADSDLPAPPSYVRDATTGKWTGEIRPEASDEELKLLGGDDDVRTDALLERWARRFDADSDGVDSGELTEEETRMASRLREEELALGPIGRRPSLPPADDGDGGGFGLTDEEFAALREVAKREYSIDISDAEGDGLGGGSASSGSGGSAPPSSFHDADLDLAYLRPGNDRRAFGSVDGGPDDDPLADLLPSDLNPARKVNRRRANPLPKAMIHHNHLGLLRRYVTPGGQIMNRAQSRLGAKDQRKVAKLVKRARHLGLIPHMGQWKIDDRGNHAHSKDVDEPKDWEEELVTRGLWPVVSERDALLKYGGFDEPKIMDRLRGKVMRAGEGREGAERSVAELQELLAGSGDNGAGAGGSGGNADRK